MKTFKQYIIEGQDVGLGHGVEYDGLNETVNATREGYNWLLNLGLLFNANEQPRKKSDEEANTYSYFSIPVNKLIEKFYESTTLFIKGDEKIEVPFYRLIQPKERKFIERLLELSESSRGLSKDDAGLLKYFTPEELYLYPR